MSAGKGKKKNGRKGGLKLGNLDIAGVGKLADLGIEWKRGNPSKSSARRSLVRENPKPKTRQLQYLNASQFDAINPNRYWTFTKASTPAGLRIRAREPIGSMSLTSNTTGGFTYCTVPGFGGAMGLNPSQGFPRLANIAVAFEEFIFHSFQLQCVPTLPTTSAGQSLMWVDYVGSASPAANSTEALSNVTSVLSSIFAVCGVIGGKQFSRLPRYFINTSADAGQYNQIFQAVVYCAVQGFTGLSGDVIGEMFIEYDCELMTPTENSGSVLRQSKILKDFCLRHLGAIDLSSEDIALLSTCNRLLSKEDMDRIRANSKRKDIEDDVTFKLVDGNIVKVVGS